MSPEQYIEGLLSDLVDQTQPHTDSRGPYNCHACGDLDWDDLLEQNVHNPGCAWEAAALYLNS